MDKELSTSSSNKSNELDKYGLSTAEPTVPEIIKTSSKSLSMNSGSSGETDDSGKGTSYIESTNGGEVEPSSFGIVAEQEKATDTINKERISCNDEESSGLSSAGDELPCNSRTFMKLEAGTSGIKKRTTAAQSRNYRNSNLQADHESSNDTDTLNRNITNPHYKTKGRNSDSDEDDEWDLPFKFMKGAAGETVSTTERKNESQTNEIFNEPSAADLSAPSHRSTPTSDIEIDFHDFDDGDDTAGHSNESFSPSSFPGPRFDENALISSSSSSSFVVENSESSSSSSDDYLEDLDDRPSETVRPLAEEADNSAVTAPDASDSSSTTSPKKKPGKKIPKKILEIPKVLLKTKPKHAWNGPKELLRREIGLSSRVQPQSAEIFRSKFYGCLFSAERLELMKKLDGHHGCVNCLNFNYSGTKLASGSDDLYIKIWDYAIGKCITSFLPGHKANVFQAKFIPLNGLDTMIVSCARDNQVRLTELNSCGKVCSSRKLAQHRGPAHKLSINPENPHVILSCGEDGVVFNIDIREEKPERLVKVWEKDKKISLFSVHQNPIFPHEFCVTGKDQYVRIYDTRKLRTPTLHVAASSGESSDGASTSGSASRTDNTPLKKFCPHHLVDSRTKTNVTAAVYNYNGKEILASYNDENIYLFDATHSDGADCTKVYEGHRNSATVKGVNFFGDRSQFVVSGSDCGNIYIWDKDTESIVNFFRGDENGVVNCLECHPTAPILATSGLDDDVKIWIPSNENSPKMSELATTVRKNMKSREDDLKNSDMDGHIMWALWSHLRQTNRDRRRAGGDGSDSNDSWWRDEDEDEDETLDLASRGVECSIS